MLIACPDSYFLVFTLQLFAVHFGLPLGHRFRRDELIVPRGRLGKVLWAGGACPWVLSLAGRGFEEEAAPRLENSGTSR